MNELTRKLGVLITVVRQYVKNIRLYLKTKKTNGSSENSVFFDLTDRRVEPYYYILIRSFYEANYTIYLNHSFLFIGSLASSGHHLFELDTLCIKTAFSKKIDSSCWLVSDQLNTHTKHSFAKVLHVNFDVYSPKPSLNCFTLPYTMSPGQYIGDYHKKLSPLRDSIKTMKIFFSGNQDPKAYNHQIFQNFFKKLNRIEALDHLKNNLNKNEILIITQSKDWSVLNFEFQNKFVLNEWQWSPQHSLNLDSRVKDDLWLETLAKSDFFLAVPGIRMPLCFNIIEAMAVGCIPITQYPEYFNPPLEHEINCLVFDSQSDLLHQVRNALAMPLSDISKMRRNVGQYYDENLSMSKFPAMINSIETNALELYINAEEVSMISHQMNLSKREPSAEKKHAIQ